jgi:hypothetical protein
VRRQSEATTALFLARRTPAPTDCRGAESECDCPRTGSNLDAIWRYWGTIWSGVGLARDGNGNSLATNDNWKDNQEAQIQASGLAPPDDNESAIRATLTPANYTAILSGKNNTVGNALVEVYALN